VLVTLWLYATSQEVTSARELDRLWTEHLALSGCKSRPGQLQVLSGMMSGDARVSASPPQPCPCDRARREALVAENLLLRHQLAVLTQPTRKRSRLRARDKLFWVVVRALRSDWRGHLVVVRPESVIRWHHQAWRLFWRWRSRGPMGRPRLSAEVRELIATMARDNPLRECGRGAR
jgi:hypothetical protein